MIGRVDTDRDGYVSEAEFYTIITRKINDWLLNNIPSINKN